MEKVSLLKPYTNFDRIKAMNIDEMASTMPCPYSRDYLIDPFCKSRNCIACTKQWLESEYKDE